MLENTEETSPISNIFAQASTSQPDYYGIQYILYACCVDSREDLIESPSL
jgi:hypothetical protein